MAITWRNDLAIGVEEIDSQHKILFEKVDSLFEACNTGRGREEIGNMLKFLGEYVVEHFSDEEFIMKKFNYPEYPKHKEIHTKFIADFKVVKAQFDKDGPTINIVLQLNKMLIDWLIQHIKKMDKEIAAYINKK